MRKEDHSTPVLSFRTSIENLRRLATVLQAGFFLEGTEGQSVQQFLEDLPGFNKDYVNNRIQTVFYNGDAIDDLGQPLSGSSATIALSTAMPGLAGAILRRNSPHAALRKTEANHRITAAGRKIPTRVKLFNNIALERGPDLCYRGVKIKSNDLGTFLKIRPTLFDSLDELSLNGQSVEPETLLSRLTELNEIIITARS